MLCSDAETQETCGSLGCQWLDVQRIDAGDDYCGIGEAVGMCFDRPDDASGCAENTICSNSEGYWYREVEAGVWDVATVRGDCVDPVPGFEPCRLDDSDPFACGCACVSGGNPSLPPGFEDTLEGAGCADINIFAVNPENTMMLAFGISDGIVDMVNTSQENYSMELDVSAFSEFRFVVGQFVSEYECNDAIANEPVIEAEWNAQSGTVTLEVVPPEAGQEGAYATATLNGVVMSNSRGLFSLDALTFEDIYVGWLPG